MPYLRTLAALALASMQAWAQCPMCWSAAQGQEAAAAKAFNAAIVVLFVPAVGLFCGVFLYAFRCRDGAGAEELPPDSREGR